MIQYRTFRNADPPGLVRVWNEACTGRGSAPLGVNLLFEYFILAKPYFDPAGLVVAVKDEAIVGFSVGGFGAGPEGKGLDYRQGVTCALAVAPGHQRRGIGGELLARSEAYLRGRGASELFAGPQEPLNPFTFGIYGGADSPGFLESDAAAGPFFEKHGYRRRQARLMLQRTLEGPFLVSDARFALARQRYEIHAGPVRPESWWREGALGPIEVHEFRLTEKASRQVAARVAVWEMEPYRPRWNQHAVGVFGLHVLPRLRRLGLGRYLLYQVLRHLQEQFFTLAEVQVAADNAPALALVGGLGFGKVDAGHQYRREP